MALVSQQNENFTAILSESILVVKRDLFFGKNNSWQGINNTDFQLYYDRVLSHAEFHPRDLMETDPAYKQIIPYLVFKYQNSYFLMQRSETASEKRLRNKYSLGIGGHVRKEDLLEGNSLFDWARREFHEEINYTGNLSIKPLGILNDDSNPVGMVHVGFVLLLEGDSNQISIRSELKMGKMAPIEECRSVFENMESWSALLLECL